MLKDWDILPQGIVLDKRMEHLFHINFIENPGQLESVRTINEVPGIVFLGAGLLFSYLKLQNSIYLGISIIGLFVSMALTLFPFYSNAVLFVDEEKMLFKHRKANRIIKAGIPSYTQGGKINKKKVVYQFEFFFSVVLPSVPLAQTRF